MKQKTYKRRDYSKKFINKTNEIYNRNFWQNSVRKYYEKGGITINTAQI